MQAPTSPAANLSTPRAAPSAASTRAAAVHTVRTPLGTIQTRSRCGRISFIVMRRCSRAHLHSIHHAVSTPSMRCCMRSTVGTVASTLARPIRPTVPTLRRNLHHHSARAASVASTAPASPAVQAVSPCVRVDKSGSILLHVSVKAGVKEWRMSPEPNVLHVRLAAPPVDGAANRALVNYLATQLSLRKSALEVVTGTTSRLKTICIDARGDSGSSVTLTPQILLQRIHAAIQSQDAPSTS
jgi:uncharacterized protein YggU (UPF0235/DUF167 family)